MRQMLQTQVIKVQHKISLQWRKLENLENWNVGCYGRIKSRGPNARVLPTSAMLLSQTSWEWHRTSLPPPPPMVKFNGQLQSWDRQRQGGRKILTQHFHYLDMFLKVPNKKTNLSNSVFLFMSWKGYAPLKTGFQEISKQTLSMYMGSTRVHTNTSIKILPLRRVLLGLYPLC